MVYPILEKMQKKLLAEKLTDSQNPRPAIPDFDDSHGPNSYITNALSFIREDCEGLRFESVMAKCRTEEEKNDVCNLKDLRGKSYSTNQIPGLMEKEVDRLCLEKTLEMFLNEGTDSAAFLVYYCYLEMFWDSTHSDPKRMITLLSEFERNASPLLSSHRDHFVHSVYVFALGLAIYHQSAQFRAAYARSFDPQNDRSDFETGHKSACHFLRLWGFTALFHDLGYPFELAYQQVDDYFDKDKTDAAAFYKMDIPAFYVSYRNLPNHDKEYRTLYKQLFPSDKFNPPRRYDANVLFAAELTSQLYDAFHNCPDYNEFRGNQEDTRLEYYKYILDILNRKASDPKSFGNNGYMDHAYFSAHLLLHQLRKPNERNTPPDKDYMKALTAVLLHNSLLSKQILNHAENMENSPKMTMELHPLAFLLILCDELQCWNRFGYGRKSRTDNHPIDCRIDVSGENISVLYYFASRQDSTGSDTLWKFSGSKPYKFVTDIEGIVYINHYNTIRLDADYDPSYEPDFLGVPLSRGSLLDAYQLAVILHGEYRHRREYNPLHRASSKGPKDLTPEQRTTAFNKLSLEYKLANVYQMLQFAYHLDKAHMFYTHRRVGFKEFDGFHKEERNEMGKMRHDTWANWRKIMGWQAGTRYLCKDLTLNDTERNRLREQLREHEYVDTAFDDLGDIKEKDIDPIEMLIKYMKEIYNIRVYRLLEDSTLSQSFLSKT